MAWHNSACQWSWTDFKAVTWTMINNHYGCQSIHLEIRVWICREHPCWLLFPFPALVLCVNLPASLLLSGATNRAVFVNLSVCQSRKTRWNYRRTNVLLPLSSHYSHSYFQEKRRKAKSNWQKSELNEKANERWVSWKKKKGWKGRKSVWIGKIYFTTFHCHILFPLLSPPWWCCENVLFVMDAARFSPTFFSLFRPFFQRTTVEK